MTQYIDVPYFLLANGAMGNTGRVYAELFVRSRFSHDLIVCAGRRSLATKLGIGEQTARRALECLEGTGMIVKVFAPKGGRGITNAYRVLGGRFIAGGLSE